jgi:DNA mismatch endonuclease (patch repair protein)
MDKFSPQQRHAKATIKQEQSDASISSAEREQARRSANMAAIRSKDTKPEMIVRRGLWSRGFRYRLNYKRLPGHPDLVLRKYRTCIFVNGCFWHGHNVVLPQMSEGRGQMEDVVNSECCKIPKTNRDFWVNKIRRNKERDKEEQKKLAAMGWHCITVWECELTPKRREDTLESIAFTLNHIWLQDRRCQMSDGRSQMCSQNDENNLRMPMAAED